MKLATKQEQEPGAVATALELYAQKAALQKQRRLIGKELHAAEATEERACGQWTRAKNLSSRGGKEVDVRRAEATYQDWHNYADKVREGVAKLDEQITGLNGKLEVLDIEPIRAEVEALTREARLIPRRLRREAYNDESERREAAERLQEVTARLQNLEPMLKDIESVQRAYQRREKIRASFAEIEAEAQRYEKAVGEALAAHSKMQKLTDGLGVADGNFNLFLLVASKDAGRTLIDNLKREI